LDGGPLVRLTAGPGPDESPSVARDGSIAFANIRRRCALLVHNLASSQTREILTHSHYIWAPAFSPDGNELAFSRGEKDGAWHIWIVPVGGGASRRLTSGPSPEIYPRFSHDGTSIIYHTWSPGPDRIWRVPRAGGPAEPVTPAREDDDSFADLSPDGRRLAFARTEKQNTRIYVSRADGSEARCLVETASTLPRWSPDGKWIAFSPSRDYGGGVFIAGADGGGMRRLTDSGGWPVWWRDGKRLGFQSIRLDGSEEILTVAPADGSVRPLPGLRFSGTNHPFDISPDNRLLATSNCADVSSEIWLLGRDAR
jgi:Tol biopolymer transport system component